MEIGQAGGDWTCLLCGRGKYVVETSGPDYEYASVPGQCCLFQCASCGHISLHPIPEPEEVAALYPPTYYTVNPASPLYLHGYIYQRKIHLDIKRIRSYVNVQKVRSVVDIGCGDAARLFELRKLVPEDAECVGLDLQFQAPLLERARKARIRLVQGSESNLNELQDAAHDLMIMSQILEHLRDPIDVLARLRTKLTPDGILLLETPNRGGLDYRLFRHRYWGGYHLPRHFHLFTKDSLALAAKRARVSSGFARQPAVSRILDTELQECDGAAQQSPPAIGLRVLEFFQPDGCRCLHGHRHYFYKTGLPHIESVCASGP